MDTTTTTSVTTTNATINNNMDFLMEEGISSRSMEINNEENKKKNHGVVDVVVTDDDLSLCSSSDSSDNNSNAGDHNNEKDTMTTTTTTATSDNTKCVSSTNGNYFGYFLMVEICIMLINGFFFHLPIYIAKKGWDRNPVALALDLYINVKESKSITDLLNFHALLGIATAGILAFQVYSAIRFSTAAATTTTTTAGTTTTTPAIIIINNKDNGGDDDNTTTTSQLSMPRLRKAHKWVGRVTILLLIVVSVSGACIAKYSNKRKDRGGLNPTLIYMMVEHLVNLGIGTYAVITKTKNTTTTGDNKKQNNRDMVLHKGSMFFALNALTQSSLGDVMLHVTQLIVNRCYVGLFVSNICQRIGEIMQLSAFVVLAYKYDPLIFQNTFVKLNLLEWTFRIVAASVVACNLYLQSTNGDENNNQLNILVDDGQPYSCFQQE